MSPKGEVLLTPEACRAGRALLGISQGELARRAGVARPMVADFERGARKPRGASLAALHGALDASGVEVIPGGVVLRVRAASAEGERRLAAALHILQSNAPKLRRLGVRHLSLFGSTARGEARPDSDLDLLVELEPRRKIDLLDYAGIAGEIQKLLPTRADIARKDRLKPAIKDAALKDEIRVF